MDKKIEKLKCKVRMALDLFMENDKELLTIGGGVHEQAISHRIAVYLEGLFKGLHVDCEYNKHGDGGKKVAENIRGARCKCPCKSCSNWCGRNGNCNNCNKSIVEIRPDIIIHKKRGDERNGNIVVIEIKKKEECKFDQAKLEALTCQHGNYKYDLGVFIYFPEVKTKKGKKIQLNVRWFSRYNPQGSVSKKIKTWKIK